MSVTVRFAPSPTGRLHLGNARTALVNRLFALKHGGRLILRIDDTDKARSRSEYEDGIKEDLRWLGIDWHEELRQSERDEVYRAGFGRLLDRNAVYPCYETPEELALRRERQMKAGLPPRYDRAALTLDAAGRAAMEAEGRKPHWRFLLPETVSLKDLIDGWSEVDLGSLSDPVIRREDGSFTYHFSSVADDIDLGVTHLIRGEDHRTNAAMHAALGQALTGTDGPVFWHLPLLLDEHGRKISKRAESLSLASMREAGIDPAAIRAVLAALGTGDAPRPHASLAELAEDFCAERVGRAQARLDPALIEKLSLELWRQRSAAEIAGTGLDEAVWQAVRENVASLEEARAWQAICKDAITPAIEEPAFLAEAAALLPPALPDGETAAGWLKAVSRQTGRKGKALYHPLRLALTGRGDGPSLQVLLPLIGRERILRRLAGEHA